jgi:hypothetical protein
MGRYRRVLLWLDDLLVRLNRGERRAEGLVMVINVLVLSGGVAAIVIGAVYFRHTPWF